MYNYHNHTNFSDDSSVSPNAMIEKAISLGFKEFAITDHYDPDYPSFEFEIDAPAYHQALLSLESQYKNQIKVIKGIEIGIQDGSTIEKCKNEVNSFPYDFVIGSFHCMHREDLYLLDYTTYNPSTIIPTFYSYCLSCLKEFMDFDILGHINVIDRYIGNLDYFNEKETPYFLSKNFKKSYKETFDVIEEILSLLIKNNKGIEINTSHIRYGLYPRTVPSEEILRLYKSLGGKILTIGSDAHSLKHIDEGLEDAISLAKSLDFKYLATYKNREISFVPFNKL